MLLRPHARGASAPSAIAWRKRPQRDSIDDRAFARAGGPALHDPTPQCRLGAPRPASCVNGTPDLIHWSTGDNVRPSPRLLVLATVELVRFHRHKSKSTLTVSVGFRESHPRQLSAGKAVEQRCERQSGPCRSWQCLDSKQPDVTPLKTGSPFGPGCVKTPETVIVRVKCARYRSRWNLVRSTDATPMAARISSGSRPDTSACFYVWPDQLPLGQLPPSALGFFVSVDLSDSRLRPTSRS
jgi:hypothetical protein